MARGRGNFSRDPVTGNLVHHPTREREDLRGGGAGSGGPGGGGAPPEANTASNINTRGVGVYDSKVGVDLRFRGIDDPTNRIDITLDPVDHVIDLDLDEDALTTLAHLALSNTFTAPNTFEDPTTFNDYIDLEDVGLDPGDPGVGYHRIYARIDSGNFQLVTRDYLSNICVLCSHAIPGVTNTLPIMWVEV